MSLQELTPVDFSFIVTTYSDNAKFNDKNVTVPELRIVEKQLSNSIEVPVSF